MLNYNSPKSPNLARILEKYYLRIIHFRLETSFPFFGQEVPFPPFCIFSLSFKDIYSFLLTSKNKKVIKNKPFKLFINKQFL